MSTSGTRTSQWLSVKEAADFIGVKTSTIYAWISTRRIPYHKVPGSQLVKFRISEIDDWLSTGKVETIDDYLNKKEKE